MTIRDDLVLVVELACLTGDRTRAEQRALLATAMRAELELNAATSRNLVARGPDARASTLVDAVEATYQPADGERPVVLAPKHRARLDRQRARFAEDHAAAWSDGRGYGAHRSAHSREGER